MNLQAGRITVLTSIEYGGVGKTFFLDCLKALFQAAEWQEISGVRCKEHTDSKPMAVPSLKKVKKSRPNIKLFIIDNAEFVDNLQELEAIRAAGIACVVSSRPLFGFDERHNYLCQIADTVLEFEPISKQDRPYRKINVLKSIEKIGAQCGK
ncbi:hypothetical protein NO1_0987 [Candidatus Termititenax aidoneus]|uniref:Uncharacterized protein n=1 Tax=Termititenax aidoneus TaxID=2218524 RepID=A0A388TAC5_TERA1|nr:hypothetical protein NO1_0987 [Candidatus Termititenax aidoneus]